LLVIDDKYTDNDTIELDNALTLVLSY